MNRELDPAGLQASEAALRRSRALQRALLEASLDGIIAVDGHGRVLQLNGIAEKMFGWTRDEALGQDIAELVVPPEYREAHRRGVARVLATGASATLGRRLEFPALRKDGSRFDVELTVVLVPEQEPALFVATLRDVTGRKAAEGALREMNERFGLVARATNDAVWDWDLERDTVWWNAAYQELFGHPAEPGVSAAESWVNHIHPEDRERVIAEIEAVQRGTAQTWSGEYRFRRRSGGYADVYDRGFVVRDASGRAVRMIGAMMDLSESKARERALRESEARFRSLVELSSDWYWEQDEEMRLVTVQGAAAVNSAVGGDVANHLGKRRWEIDGTELVEGDWAAHRALLARHEPFRNLLQRRTLPDGSQLHFSVSGEPIFDAQGGFRGYRGVGRDVTAARRVEEDLRRFRLAMDNTADLVAIIDAQTLTYVDVNITTCKVLGFAREDLIGKPVQNTTLSPAELRRMYDEVIASPARAGTFRGHFTRKDGSRIPVEARRHAFQSDGRWLIVSIARDVTERDAAEEALRRRDAYFRAVIEHSGDAIAVYDKDMRLRYRSPAAARLSGYANEERMGGAMEDVVLEEDMPAVRAALDEVLLTPGHAARYRCRVKQKGGSVLHVEGTATNMFHDPAVNGLVLNYRDVSDRVRAEDALKRFRLALDRSGELIALIDLETMRYVDANEALCAALGYSREELLCMHPDELIPFDREALRETYRRLTQGEQPPAIRSYYRCKDGSRFPYESRRHAVLSDGRWLIVSIARDIRRDLAAEEALRKREEEFRAVAENAPDGIMRFDAALRCLYANSAIEKTIGLSREALLGRALAELPVAPEARETLENGLRRALATGVTQTIDFSFDGPRGLRYYHARLAPELGADGKPATVLGISSDVTAQRLAERATAESEARLRSIVYASAEPLLLVDSDGRTLFANPAAGALFGRTPRALEGAVLGLPLAAGRPAEVDIVLPEGGTRPAELQFAPTQLDGREVLVVSLHDLSERKRFEEHIRHLATHDGLTGLPNRAVLGDRVAQAIASARRGGHTLALLFVDLDQFKLVNDSFGHAAGDALLNEVAARLRSTVRDGDTVARLGGDEFVLLLTDLARPDDSALVARKVAQALDRPVELESGELRVTASIGISLFPDDGQDLEALLQCADAAMYRAKDLGRNAFHYYSAEMGEQARVRVDTEAGLRRALERDEFRLHFQPQVDFRTGAVTAVEALLRWEHPERGMISPASFIPVAEESGLIVPIGQWALRDACREAAAWSAAGIGPIKVSVNLSARQFWRGSVTDAVRAALAESGLPASQLELEITESVVARDLNQVMLSLEQLRRMGVSIAIDDFGTGYSSLAYLRSLPIQKLKVDKSFIQNIPGDREATALVGEIVRLAHILSLHVVAEGVETEAQAAFLRDAGCEAMQGFLFSRPLPGNDVAALLRSGRIFTLTPPRRPEPS